MKKSKSVPRVSFILKVLAVGTFLGSIWLCAQAIAEPHHDNNSNGKKNTEGANADATFQNAAKMVVQGQQTFRYDTFGDETFWSDKLQLHRAIEGEAFGGVGSGISPTAALDLGLKVDVQALPQRLVEQLKHRRVDLNNPAVTLDLLKLDAIVGVKGTFNSDGSLKSVGLTCAICHSTVNDSLAPGIGKRL